MCKDPRVLGHNLVDLLPRGPCRDPQPPPRQKSGRGRRRAHRPGASLCGRGPRTPGPRSPRRRPGSQASGSGRYLSLLERRRIVALRERGLTVREVASLLGLAPSTVSREWLLATPPGPGVRLVCRGPAKVGYPAYRQRQQAGTTNTMRRR
ncbi:helix-turn-helix domain-containing protein [Streptomyces sp. NPDC005917]|uniref:helix-turn-helix domain-containing protein n=1 Tax=unclassified Streptomyces TaxID=2593676 RepID=UPI0033D11BD2